MTNRAPDFTFIEKTLRDLVNGYFAQDGGMRALCLRVLDDERWRRGFGSAAESNKHHAYPGGLMVHTYEVMGYAGIVAEQFAGADLGIIIPAVIWHDFAKIYDYDAKGNKTPYREIIRHVAGSYAAFEHDRIRMGINTVLAGQIGHVILAHHGRKEWGSPVEPQTSEALIVHQADMWSARFGPHKDWTSA